MAPWAATMDTTTPASMLGAPAMPGTTHEDDQAGDRPNPVRRRGGTGTRVSTQIVGRINQDAGWRTVFRTAPLGRPIKGVELLAPDLPEDLDGWERLKSRRCCRVSQRSEEGNP